MAGEQVDDSDGTVRIGVLGASRIAPLAVLKPAAELPHVRVVCVAASQRHKAEEFAANHGIDSVADSYAELVTRADVDLVYNGLAPRDHCQWTLAALDAGKHVLCEKPFALNAMQARQMAQRAEATGKVLIEAFHYRFHPLFSRLMEIVRSGQVGVVRRLNAHFGVLIPPRRGEFRHDAALGGGATMDLGCYPVHWMRTLMGCEPVVTQATAQTGSPGVDVAMSARLRFPGGVTAAISCSMAQGQSDGPNAWLHVEGSSGRLEVDNPLSPDAGHELRLIKGGRTQRIVVPGKATFYYQMLHVIGVIASDVQPLTGGRDAVANMALIDAIYARAGMQPRGAAG